MRDFDKAQADAKAREHRDKTVAKLKTVTLAYCRTCKRTVFVYDVPRYELEHSGHDYQFSYY